MSLVRYAVQIDGTAYASAEQAESNPAWKRALAFAHKKRIAHCLCNPCAPIQLAIKHYRAGTDAGFYGLARWPETGLDHRLDCAFFGQESDAVEPEGHSPAFEDLGDRRVRVFLARPLAMDGATGKTREVPGSLSKSPVGSRARATDISVLNKIWRDANLNVHRGKEVRWFMASIRAMHAAARMVFDQAGNTIADVLLLGTQASNNTVTEHNCKVIAAAARKRTRLFVIARLKPLSPGQMTKANFLLPVRDFDGLPKTLINRAQYDAFLQGREFLQRTLADQTGSIVAICCIEPAGNDWWRCIDIKGIAVTKDMIPVESSFEDAMARHLVAEGRLFVKPVHVDEMDATGHQRPDFILLDMEPKVMVEVWGMRTPEYLANKERRLAQYRARGVRVISWNADQGDPLPPLPPAGATLAAIN